MKEWRVYLIYSVGLMLLTGLFCLIANFLFYFLILYSLSLLLLCGITLNCGKDILKEIYRYNRTQLRDTKREVRILRYIIVIGIILQLSILFFHVFNNFSSFPNIEPFMDFAYRTMSLIVLLLEVSAIFMLNEVINTASILLEEKNHND